jgi:hypothetical protein
LNSSGSTGNASTGDLFTLYDLGGLIGTPTISSTLAANGFSTFKMQNLGVSPVTTAPPDSPTVVNITFPYTSLTAIVNGSGAMNLFLGQFSFVSSYGPSPAPNVYYTSAAQRSDNSLLSNNVSQLVGPVPEPATLLLAAIALAMTGGFWWLRSFRFNRAGLAVPRAGT